MKTITKIFLRIPTENSRTLTLTNGITLFFDDSYNENWHRQQIGQIAYIPEKYTTADNETPLKVGDVVYFHHLATDDNNKIVIDGETLYMQPIEQIYAVKRGDEIIGLRDCVFVEQMVESEDSIKTASGIFLKSAPDETKQTGIVIGLPPCSKEWNILGGDFKFDRKLKIGDTIFFKPKSEYQINADFGKRKVYKMPLENVLMVYN